MAEVRCPANSAADVFGKAAVYVMEQERKTAMAVEERVLIPQTEVRVGIVAVQERLLVNYAAESGENPVVFVMVKAWYPTTVFCVMVERNVRLAVVLELNKIRREKIYGEKHRR